MSDQPNKRLYVDIDGVVIANYGCDWQVRPYVRTLVAWAEKQGFEVFWVSYNSHKVQIVDVVAHGIGTVVTDYFDYDRDEKGFKVRREPTWHPLAMESEKLQAVHITGGLDGEWFFIEDTPPTEAQRKILEEKGILHRWIVVPDSGSDVLLECRHILSEYLKTGKLIVPYEWCSRISAERDMWVNGEWKGYGKSKRS